MQGIDMKAKYEAGIAALDQAHWQKKAALKQAGKNQQLREQIKKSYDDSMKVLRQNGVSTPVGVAVIVYGLHQKVDDKKNKTDLDQKADNLRNDGYLVIEVQSGTLADVSHPSEPSESGTEILAQTVAEIAANGSTAGAIEITGFSRGGGGAVQLTNALTDSGISGSRISLDL